MIRRSSIGRLCCWAIAAGAAGAAGAAPPAALVEEVRGPVAGIEFMDYVVSGQRIALGERGVLVLGYLRSCWRETIAGGTVTVGDDGSVVQGGRIERTKVACDPGHAPLNAREATQSAATVFRGLPGGGVAEPPPVTVYGLSPVFDVGDRRGRLRIERVAPSGEAVEIAVDAASMVAGRFVDLARAGTALTPGATYAARLGDAHVGFKVDWDAQPGSTPIAGRLLRLE